MQDFVYAFRTLGKSRVFTFVAVLTLALGIGANTAIFSVIHAVLLRPLPYRNAGELVFLWSTRDGAAREALTPGRLLDFKEQLTSVSAMAGISHLSVNLTGSGDPERVPGSSVSSNFFEILGVPPLLGDVFHARRADDRDVVLSYRLWNRRFGGDRSIVGREIVVNGTARRVTAVMPAEFDWPLITGGTRSSGGGPELWIPAARRDIPRMPNDDPNLDLSANRSTGYLRAVARLGAGVALAQAQREVDGVAARLAAIDPQHEGGRGAVLQPLVEQFFGSVREPLYVLAGAVGFVLAIACANAASLLLGRSASRRREVAVRIALGASRSRIVRQLLSEAMVLAFGGAAAGIVLAWWGNAWLVSLAPDSALRLDEARIDGAVLLFTLVMSVLTGVFFGLVPACQASRSTPGADLNDASARSTSGRRAGRARDLLVGAEICVALVLLVAAGLLLRSFTALARVDTGIDTRNLLTFDITLSGGRADGPARTAFYDETLRAIRSLPGVRAAGAAVTLPVGGDDFSTYFTVEGQSQPLPGQEPRAGYQIVTPGYFQAMGIEIVRGRDLSDADTADAPQVVLVNETLARQHWPGADAVGRRVRKGSNTADPWMTVVGVVGDIRHLGPAVPPRPELYEVHRQSPFSFMAFVVRTEGAPERLVPSIRAAIARIDPAVPMARVGTMEAHVERSLSRPRFMSTLTLAFGALALLLALVGVYGLMAYSVAQRTREFAIRTALGARSSDVLGLVVRKALVIAVSGVVVGLAAAATLSRVLEGMLFGIGATDPITYLGVSGLMIAVALVAAVVPAVRAARVDGAAVLRY